MILTLLVSRNNTLSIIQSNTDCLTLFELPPAPNPVILMIRRDIGSASTLIPRPFQASSVCLPRYFEQENVVVAV